MKIDFEKIFHPAALALLRRLSDGPKWSDELFRGIGYAPSTAKREARKYLEPQGLKLIIVERDVWHCPVICKYQITVDYSNPNLETMQ